MSVSLCKTCNEIPCTLHLMQHVIKMFFHQFLRINESCCVLLETLCCGSFYKSVEPVPAAQQRPCASQSSSIHHCAEALLRVMKCELGAAFRFVIKSGREREREGARRGTRRLSTDFMQSQPKCCKLHMAVVIFRGGPCWGFYIESNPEAVTNRLFSQMLVLDYV